MLEALAGPAIGAVIGGALGYGGAKESARMSRGMAREQMKFQEKMSNTAYQRAADDLEAAGLNRIIAFGSPASTPSGAMGQVPDFGSAIIQGMGAGTGVVTSGGQVAKMDAEVKNLLEQASINKEKFQQEVEKTKLWQEIRPVITDTAASFRDLLEVLKTIPADAWANLSGNALDMIEIIVTNKFGAPAGVDFIDIATEIRRRFE